MRAHEPFRHRPCSVLAGGSAAAQRVVGVRVASRCNKLVVRPSQQAQALTQDLLAVSDLSTPQVSAAGAGLKLSEANRHSYKRLPPFSSLNPAAISSSNSPYPWNHADNIVVGGADLSLSKFNVDAMQSLYCNTQRGFPAATAAATALATTPAHHNGQSPAGSAAGGGMSSRMRARLSSKSEMSALLDLVVAADGTKRVVDDLWDACCLELEELLARSGRNTSTSASQPPASNIVPWPTTSSSTLDCSDYFTRSAAQHQNPPAADTVEQLVVVYLKNTDTPCSNASAAAAAAPAVPPPCSVFVGEVQPPRVRYLRLPQQQEEYEEVLQQGLVVVPLPGALQRSGDGAISMEEVAWMNQESWAWGHEEQPQELFSSQEQELQEQQQQAVVEAVGDGVQQEQVQLSPPATVKVEVGVRMCTQPGQRVVLVGSHPSLGSWDLGRAWKLKWSDGHVWRGCLELPADIRGFEFKAVLKSAEAVIWERGNNRRVTLAGAQQQPLALNYAFNS